MKWIIDVLLIAMLVVMFGLILLNIVTGCSYDNPRACFILGW